MRKNITKVRIIKTTLELMRDMVDIGSLNMRDIAGTLGCAHTNLYNYFPSFTDLLWETHAAIQEMFLKIMNEKLANASTADLKLKCFFNTFADIYLDNKGWFRLVWLEYIGDSRPERDVTATEQSFTELTRHISDILQELHGKLPDKEKVGRVLHNTHCYIVGEVSNYISGRGLIDNEADLKNYVVEEAVIVK